MTLFPGRGGQRIVLSGMGSGRSHLLPILLMEILSAPYNWMIMWTVPIEFFPDQYSPLGRNSIDTVAQECRYELKICGRYCRYAKAQVLCLSLVQVLGLWYPQL